MMTGAMTISAIRGYAVEPVDLPTATDDLLREVNELQNVMARERTPEDPPVPVEALASRVRTRPKLLEMRDWLVRAPGGELVARASIARYRADTNQHLRDASIDVAAPHRRKGIGTRLYREIVGAAGSDDVVISFGTSDRVPSGAAFMARIGARQTLANHINQLDLARLDRAMVREWGGIDTPGYRLVWIDGDVPDALLPNVIAAYDAMNTAPRGDSAMEDWNTTPEIVRDWDASRRASGRERRLLLAIAEKSGETAGYTELAYDPKVPHVIWQQGTAVIPAHRSQGIGKWIKAAMLERALRDWPTARLVRTGNADTNAPMLAINTRLGFRPAWAWVVWEIGIVDARRYLESAQP
jgi:GNAT superfamily N-acetyltransferase